MCHSERSEESLDVFATRDPSVATLPQDDTRQTAHGKSTPPLLHGLQRRIRQMVFGTPRKRPYFFIV